MIRLSVSHSDGYFLTVLPAFLLTAGIRSIGSGDASLIGSIGPIFTIYLALVILKEKGFAPAARWFAAGLGWRSNGPSQ
jgi:drug/metabolite transporter (DMT)-like permease